MTHNYACSYIWCHAGYDSRTLVERDSSIVLLKLLAFSKF